MNVLKSVGHWLLSNGGILIAAISGIFSLFADHQNGRKWTLIVAAGVLGGFFWSLASADFADQQQKRAMEDAIGRVDRYVETQSTVTVSKVDTNTRAALNELMHQYLGVRTDVAQQATPEQAREIVTAGASATGIIQTITPTRRNALTIWVFPHAQQEVDFGVVKARLQQLAANVDLHGLKQQAAQTNSVWYGGGASLEEAKAAALTVASAGLQIKQVCPASSVQAKDLIQIGGSVGAQKMPVLAPSQIQDLKSKVCE